MRVIDPLRIKLPTLLKARHSQPIAAARASYGSPDDYVSLGRAISAQTPLLAPAMVDFTPMERLGRVEAVRAFLGALERPCTFLVLGDEVLTEIKDAGLTETTQCAVFDSNGASLRFEPVATQHMGLSTVRNELLLKMNTLQRIRASAATMRLIGALGSDGVVYPYDPDHQAHQVEWYDGVPYLRMTNDMLVSCFIHLKRALRNADRLLDVAYEVALALNDYFVEAVPQNERPELLVVPNNTALFLASMVQLLTGIPVSVIDKLGPIPSRRLSVINTSVPVGARNVAVLVEVTATGGEVDRTIQYLSGAGASIVRLVSCYDLDVGTPMLRDKVPFVSLCKPKQALGYVYRSHNHVNASD